MEIKNPILKQIWSDRYKKECDTCEDDNIERVAEYCSYNNKEKEDFVHTMSNKLFFPAGRTMSNSGIGTDLTLNNCFNSNHVPDNIEGIFDRVKLGALTHKRGGGIGYDFSLIRPNGTETSNDAIASGVVSFMDVFNTQTSTILQGGRRGANMGVLNIYHPDIFEYLESKSWDEGKLVHFNLSVMVDDKFMLAKDNDEEIYLHYPVYDEQSKILEDPSKWIISKKVRARDLWDIIMKKAYDTGEYGVFFYDNLNRDNNTWYIETIVSSNPCFRGDMKILTSDGYIEISKLDGKQVTMINKNGSESCGKVWCSGEKEIYKIRLNNNKELFCTKDHRFMTTQGNECEAQFLKGERIMPYLNSNIETNKEFELYGFLQGDGDLGRLKSEHHLGLEMNIGKDDYDIAEYFMLNPLDKKVYLVGFNEKLIELGFSSEKLPKRVLPTTINKWSILDKKSFLRGLYSANGSVISCGRITFKTTCKQLSEQLKEMLMNDFNIDSYITTNKAHEVKFSNGTYMCKESYDVNINRFEEKVKFFNTIGFLQKYKVKRLKNNLIQTSPVVSSVKTTSKIEKVYDFNEPLTHWGVIEGFIAHNCGEYVSGTIHGKNPNTEEVLVANDFMGACNLGSIFLHNYVKNPYTKDAYFDFDLLEKEINIAVRFLDNIIDINKYPHSSYEKYQKSIRTIGLGHTGIADALCMLNMVYGSKEAVEYSDMLFNEFAKFAYKASIELAKEKGEFPLLDRYKFVRSGFIQKHIHKDKEWMNIVDGISKYGIRNGRILSVAPVGTLSLTFGDNCSSGLEPIFSLEYDRKVKIGGQSDDNIQIVKMRDYAYEEWLKVKNSKDTIVKDDIFVTAMNLSVEAHLNMLEIIAYHTDMSCSKTINIPTEYPFEDTKRVYDECWKRGIKGCTIFRPNPLRQGIFVTESNNKEENNEIIELKRGEWKSLADDTIYIKKSLKIGCGKLKVFIGYSPKEKKIQDIYIKKAGNGGCLHNLEALSISLSAIYRLGGSTENIEKAFEGIGGCNSFLQSRMKGNELSKGSSCATAILNILKEIEKDLLNIEVDKITTQPNTNKKEEKKLTDDEIKFIKDNGEVAFAKHYNKCPICGESLQNAGGCLSCIGCGFSKCE